MTTAANPAGHQGSRFSVAGLQLALPRGDNRAVIAEEVARAMRRFPWLDMILVPELAALSADIGRAEPMPGETEQFFQALARAHKVWLLPGSIYEKLDGKIYNTAPVIDPQGHVIARYRKIYPFLPYETGVASGSQICVFDVPGIGRFGVSICYDGWFPELTRAMAWEGAEVVLHPTMTTTVDRDEELVLARANAIQGQCYFLDINNTGQLGNGRSIFVGPEGEVLHQAGEAQEFVTAVLDLEHVRQSRRDGIKGLGQVLKSFRDTPMHYACYDQGGAASPHLAQLGPLQMRKRAGNWG
jgi:predicted amidohydrolase